MEEPQALNSKYIEWKNYKILISLNTLKIYSKGIKRILKNMEY